METEGKKQKSNEANVLYLRDRVGKGVAKLIFKEVRLDRLGSNLDCT